MVAVVPESVTSSEAIGLVRDAVAMLASGVSPAALEEGYVRRSVTQWLEARRGLVEATKDDAESADGLRRWCAAVLAGVVKLEGLPGAVRRTVPLGVAAPLADLRPVLKQIRVLVAAGVPRWLVAPAEAEPLLTAHGSLCAARNKLEEVRRWQLTSLVKPSARTSLTLSREIKALRDPGAWWGLDRKISDGALKRTRPHLTLEGRKMGRHDIARVLERLNKVVKAEERLKRAQAAFMDQCSAAELTGDDSAREAVVTALSDVCRVLETQRHLTEAVDGVWAVPALSGIRVRAIAQLASLGDAV